MAISKANTFAQIGFVALVLAALSFGWPRGGAWFRRRPWARGGIDLGSLAAYFRRWMTHMTPSG